MNRQHLTLYGLKWNPFETELPVEGLMTTPAVDSFCRRIEHHLVRQGGFALIAGEPGAGKSVALRLLAKRLPAGEGPHTMALLAIDSLALNGGTIRSTATGADAALAHGGAAYAGVITPSTRTRSTSSGPTARFSALPESHDGTSAFEVELAFSGDPGGISYVTVRDSLIEATGGAIGNARRKTKGNGTVSSTLTGLYPWGRYALSDRVEVWGAAGYGEGALTLTPEGADAIRTDMDLWMAAAGLRGTVIDGGADGFTLTAKTDAMAVETSTAAVPGDLAASEAGVTRLRLGLEGSLPVRLGGGSVLTPSMEIGARHDGGDAETGFGADIGGGIAWNDPKRGLNAEIRGRGLLTHEADGFRERGLSGTLGWNPVEDDRGPSLSLTQTFGGAASGGADALLQRGTMEGLAANHDGAGSDDLKARRLEARFGYGFAAFGDGFTLTPEAGFGLSDTGRDYSLGWRLVRVERGGGIPGSSLELSFEATRRESAANDNIPPEHGVGLRLTSRF